MFQRHGMFAAKCGQLLYYLLVAVAPLYLVLRTLDKMFGTLDKRIDSISRLASWLALWNPLRIVAYCKGSVSQSPSLSLQPALIWVKAWKKENAGQQEKNINYHQQVSWCNKIYKKFTQDAHIYDMVICNVAHKLHYFVCIYNDAAAVSWPSNLNVLLASIKIEVIGCIPSVI